MICINTGNHMDVMVNIEQASQDELLQAQRQLEQEYAKLAALNLSLDLTRGKPGPEQVALSDALDGILGGNYIDADGVDTRNYGGLQGLREARELFAPVLGADPENLMIGGNSSLSLMYAVVECALNIGLCGSAWSSQLDKPGAIKFICPVPGYDRHFAICEHLGITMLPVAMTDSGPDMDAVEHLLATEPGIRGMWCVPRFSNPDGVVYSEQTVQRIARLGQIAHDSFLVLWDNAYAVHSFDDDAAELPSISAYCDALKTQDQVVQFGSTSKVTFAGAGVAFLASGERTRTNLSKHLGYSSIGPDKVNQLRHVRLLRDAEGLGAHMRKHAALIAPRFACLQRELAAGLGGSGMGHWTEPGGGYFVSFDSLPGLAKEIVELAATIGVKLTPAGATWPYGKDPENSNIRLAPTFATLPELEAAVQAFVCCVKLASIRQRLARA